MDVSGYGGNVMTRIETDAIRERWSQRFDAQVCDHLIQELESDDEGHVTGRYICIACGEHVAYLPHAV
jgi:hypothetical protein